METSASIIEQGTPTARRPIRSRGSRSVRRLATRLAAQGVAPNAISAASIGFAALTAACLLLLPMTDSDLVRAALLVGAAASVQLRLMCNLLDGLVAIEGGRKSATGDLFNEVPDRVADTLALVSAGYAVTWVGWAPELAWAAALSAALTAYLRVLGGSLRLVQDFSGPLAKQQRMAVLTIACLGSLVELAAGFEGRVLVVALALIAAGSLLTCLLRLRRLASALRERA